jgi:drug/metabolite transporter (DMT)-like permease
LLLGAPALNSQISITLIFPGHPTRIFFARISTRILIIGELNSRRRAALSSKNTTPSPVVVRAMIAFLCLIWGSTWLVIKSGLRDLPPFTSAGVRFAIAALIMIGVASVLGRREGGEKPPVWLWIVQGTASFAMSYGIVYYTETILPSGLVSLLFGVYPMLQALAGHFFLDEERLMPYQWIGFGVGLLGLILLFRTDLQSFGPEGIPTGLLLMLSPISVVIGTTLVKRFGGGVNSTLLNRNGMFVGAALLLGVAFALERDAVVTWTPAAIASVLYLAIMGTVVTFSLFFWLLRSVPAHKMALIAYVTPAIALFLGWAFADEPVTVWTLSGAACVLSGVLLVVHRRHPARQETE